MTLAFFLTKKKFFFLNHVASIKDFLQSFKTTGSAMGEEESVLKYDVMMVNSLFHFISNPRLFNLYKIYSKTL